MKLREIIPAVAGLMSITGYETYAAAELTPWLGAFDADTTDTVGNRILVRRCGRENAPRILIDAHFDEIGFFVTDIREGGFLAVAPVGGQDLRSLPAADVKIYGTRVLDGVITSTPPHLQKKTDKPTLTPVDELLVDTGYTKDELAQWVRIGTPVGYVPRYVPLENGRIAGKSFDNKACCAVAIAALSEIPAHELAGDVYLVLAAHEETDRIGGTAVGGMSVDPHYAMVLDGNIGRTPHTKACETVALGKGPSITRGAIVHRTLTKMTEALCERAGIPWQRSIEPAGTGTDTTALHLVGTGIPVVDVGLPLRSMHTAVEMLDHADAEQLAALVRAFVCDREIAEVFA
ncbi:MAG: M20/M25/M40 family metallo-hydrolase [Clostridia bacterium]|nr:M20/M25/M40 family metallo-hydrolase [Clostridia bacterium]